MSRVDEAMRRASAHNPEAAAVVANDAAQVEALGLTGALGVDAFPAEVRASTPVPQVESPRHQPASNVTRTIKPAAVALTGTPDHADESDAVRARLSASLAEKVIVDRETPHQIREQYRTLGAVLLDAQAESGTRVVMVASAVPSEGKTLTACNLALTLSESYQKRVLLIDGDLRRPTLQEMFRINASSGLSESLLASSDDTKLLIRQVSPNLSLLPAGRPSSDPMASLTSDRMRRLLEEARETFDWVIIDTPPLVLLPDANLLAPMADGVILVVRAESTPHSLVSRAIEAIGRNRTLGVVLNRAHGDEGSYGGYQYYAYSPSDPKGRR